MKDGDVFERTKIMDKGQAEDEEEVERDDSIGLNKYVILASRYKPDFIDSMATQKDVIRLFLQS